MNFIEGDMRVTPLLTQIRNGQHNGVAGGGDSASKLKWRSNVIPYTFDPTLSKSLKIKLYTFSQIPKQVWNSEF